MMIKIPGTYREVQIILLDKHSCLTGNGHVGGTADMSRDMRDTIPAYVTVNLTVTF